MKTFEERLDEIAKVVVDKKEYERLKRLDDEVKNLIATINAAVKEGLYFPSTVLELLENLYK